MDETATVVAMISTCSTARSDLSESHERKREPSLLSHPGLLHPAPYLGSDLNATVSHLRTLNRSSTILKYNFFEAPAPDKV